MSAGSTSLDEALLSLILTNATAGLTGIGDAAGLQPSPTAGALYVSLHSAAPGKGGDQSSSELSFTGYARVAVPRAATSWSIAAPTTASVATATNLTAITFGTVTGGPTVTAGWVGVGTTAAGTGFLLLSAALNTPVILTAGYTPFFPTGSLAISCD
jgi:hypothetical protein